MRMLYSGFIGILTHILEASENDRLFNSIFAKCPNPWLAIAMESLLALPIRTKPATFGYLVSISEVRLVGNKKN